MTRSVYSMIALFLAVMLSHVSFAQVTWKRTYGGLGSEKGYGIKTLSDGGAVICGSTGSFGAQGGDIYVFRVDINGVLIWSKLLGGTGVDVGKDILHLTDGTFLVIGSSNSFGLGDYDGYVVRLSSEGDVIWERTYGSGEWDFFEGGAETQDGYYVAGQTFNGPSGVGNAWVNKVSTTGEVEWDMNTGWAGEDGAVGILDLGLDGCVIGGTKDVGTPESSIFLKGISQDGLETWSTVIVDDGSQTARGVTLTQDGEFLVAGFSEDLNERRQMYLARMNGSGGLLWSRAVSSAGDDWEANSVVEHSDGRIIVGGYTKEYGAGGKDMSMLILSSDGYFESGPTYGGSGDEEAFGLDLTNDGGYYLVGYTESYGPGIESVFVLRNDGDTLNGAVVRTNDTVSIPPIFPESDFGIYPNPSTSGSTITVTGIPNGRFTLAICDSMGKEVYSGMHNASQIDLPPFSPGLYLFRLEHELVSTRSILVIE